MGEGLAFLTRLATRPVRLAMVVPLDLLPLLPDEMVAEEGGEGHTAMAPIIADEGNVHSGGGRALRDLHVDRLQLGQEEVQLGGFGEVGQVLGMTPQVVDPSLPTKPLGDEPGIQQKPEARVRLPPLAFVLIQPLLGHVRGQVELLDPEGVHNPLGLFGGRGGLAFLRGVGRGGPAFLGLRFG